MKHLFFAHLVIAILVITPYTSTISSTPPPTAAQEKSPGIITTITGKAAGLYKPVKQWITHGFTTAESAWTRFLLALCLGILLSLTPCIYPMIPITVGILQIGKARSTSENFLRALIYTLGISTTFAILGFLAAVGGSVFGELQSSPWFIIPLALLLLYFGLSMLDFWQVRIPTFLKPTDASTAGSSLLSVYLFGLVSGTVASPCLSPGLILILNSVAHLTKAASLLNFLHGFVLLFVFGIGSSLPLLIIGTFSTSVQLMPKAGPWMVEVKRLIGVILIAMALYHLQYILPAALALWLPRIFLTLLTIYYGSQALNAPSAGLRLYRIAVATLLGFSLYMTFTAKNNSTGVAPATITWHRSYDQAHELARQEYKPLLLNIGATYCTTCKAISKAVFESDDHASLMSTYIPLKVEADVDKTTYAQIIEKYGSFIRGYPTIIIIDAETEQILKTWPQDDVSPESLIRLLSSKT